LKRLIDKGDEGLKLVKEPNENNEEDNNN